MTPTSNLSDLRQDIRRLEDRHEDLRRDVVLSYVSNRALEDDKEKATLRLTALDLCIKSVDKKLDDYIAGQKQKEVDESQNKDKKRAHFLTLLGIVISVVFSTIGAILGILSYLHAIHP